VRGVEIELRYRHAAFLAAVEEPWSAAALVKHRTTGTEAPGRRPTTIVQKVPKVKDYKFFTTENRVAIVDPQGSRVSLVIEQRR
jgi:hypothetical protein